MKKFLLLVSAASFLFVSCKSLPVIEHAGQPDKQLNFSPFLKVKYQLTHSIKADLPNENKALLIGLTSIDPAARSMNAVLMTVEGLVLFDVSYKDNSTLINRGVPPFDSSDFSKGLIDDLKLIYFAPEGKEIESGMLTNNRYAKRYACIDGTTVDVITDNQGIAEINKYDSANSLLRTIKILSFPKEGLPEKIELTAHGFFGYSLYLELINSERY